jgi:hypothetical protein
MEGLDDHAARGAHRFRGRPQRLEGALAGAEVGHAEEPVEGDEAHRRERAGEEPAEQAGAAHQHLGATRSPAGLVRASAGTRRREPRESLPQRGHHALGAPPEGREAVAPAARARTGEGSRLAAEPAGERSRHAGQAQRDAAVGAADHLPALVAAERGRLAREHQGHPRAPAGGVLEGPRERQRERMIAEDAAGIRGDQLGPRVRGFGAGALDH